MSSQLGDLGSGLGKGGGGGGSIRQAGGAFGKKEAAHEEEYFHKKVILMDFATHDCRPYLDYSAYTMGSSCSVSRNCIICSRL